MTLGGSHEVSEKAHALTQARPSPASRSKLQWHNHVTLDTGILDNSINVHTMYL